MADREHDIEYLRMVFQRTEVLRKPISGIVSGYHVLPYILVGSQLEKSRGSTEIRGIIRVSPRLLITPSQLSQTYGEIFKDTEVMDQALIGRTFSFLYAMRQNIHLESDDLQIRHSDVEPHLQLDTLLEELHHQEDLKTGLILSPDVSCYPTSLERFIREILDREFGAD